MIAKISPMLIESVVKLAKTYVAELFEKELRPGMYFHHLDHTIAVFQAATNIGQRSGLNQDDLAIVQLSALFHDTGYLYYYEGHEEQSKVIASNYLLQAEVDFYIIEQVVACIESTKMPQKPINLMQEIVCDADLSHFAAADYLIKAENLRKEWYRHLGKIYSEKQWALINMKVLKNHTYFTAYGRDNLQLWKNKNINRLKIWFGLTEM